MSRKCNTRRIEYTVFDADKNHLLGQDWDEFVVENIVIGCIPDCAANDTDCECESCNCGDKVVRTDDSGDDACWDDYTADAQTSYDEDAINGVKIVETGSSKSTTTGGHHAGRDDHEHSVPAAEDGEKDKNDTSSSENTKTDGHATEANLDGVVAVHIEGLRGPEQEDREEVGARDEGNH